jgi:hypothetical protein
MVRLHYLRLAGVIAIGLAVALDRASAVTPPEQQLTLELRKTIGLEGLGHLTPAGSGSTYYPARARDADIAGSVILKCNGAPNTRLSACQVLGEDPLSWNFGENALGLVELINQKGGPQSQAKSSEIAILPVRFTIKGLQAATTIVPTEYWSHIPTPDRISSVYPLHARQIGEDGFSAMRCTALSDGNLSDCQTWVEFPEREGFGEAATKLAKEFKINPAFASAVKGEKIDLFLKFHLP